MKPEYTKLIADIDRMISLASECWVTSADRTPERDKWRARLDVRLLLMASRDDSKAIAA